MRIAKRITKRLPVKPMAKSGHPKDWLCVVFRVTDQQAVKEAIDSLVDVVREKKPRRYFPIPMLDTGFEYQNRCGPVRLIQTYNIEHNEILVRAEVWIG